jgi:site-specific DNA recombinase
VCAWRDGDRFASLRIEREQLKSDLETSPTASTIVSLHPAALARYEVQLARLQGVLADGTAAGETEAAAAIRDLVETVTARPDQDDRGGVVLEIVGRLNALLGDRPGANKGGSLSAGKVVAGAGIEPATYGL